MYHTVSKISVVKLQRLHRKFLNNLVAFGIAVDFLQRVIYREIPLANLHIGGRNQVAEQLRHIFRVALGFFQGNLPRVTPRLA